MNLKQLLFVRAVAETHSFSQAAAQCYATQPTLSNAISQLEQELGGKLFTRTTRKVTLTAFGTHILPFICALLDDKQELEKAAYAYHHPAHSLLRIGLSPLIDMKLVNQILMPYQQAHPEVSIFFKECLLDDLKERMYKEQIDFAIVPTHSYDTIQPHCFFYEEPLYYLPQEKELSSKKAFHYQINELPASQIILTGGGCGLNGTLERLFNQENSTFNAYPGQALSYKVIEEWASLGIGAGILPKAKITPENKNACPLILKNGKPATFSYQWVWAQQDVTRCDILSFIDYLMTTVPALIEGENRLAAV